MNFPTLLSLGDPRGADGTAPTSRPSPAGPGTVSFVRVLADLAPRLLTDANGKPLFVRPQDSVANPVGTDAASPPEPGESQAAEGEETEPSLPDLLSGEAGPGENAEEPEPDWLSLPDLADPALTDPPPVAVDLGSGPLPVADDSAGPSFVTLTTIGNGAAPGVAAPVAGREPMQGGPAKVIGSIWPSLPLSDAGPGASQVARLAPGQAALLSGVTEQADAAATGQALDATGTTEPAPAAAIGRGSLRPGLAEQAFTARATLVPPTAANPASSVDAQEPGATAMASSGSRQAQAPDGNPGLAPQQNHPTGSPLVTPPPLPRVAAGTADRIAAIPAPQRPDGSMTVQPDVDAVQSTRLPDRKADTTPPGSSAPQAPQSPGVASALAHVAPPQAQDNPRGVVIQRNAGPESPVGSSDTSRPPVAASASASAVAGAPPPPAQQGLPSPMPLLANRTADTVATVDPGPAARERPVMPVIEKSPLRRAQDEQVAVRTLTAEVVARGVGPAIPAGVGLPSAAARSGQPATDRDLPVAGRSATISPAMHPDTRHLPGPVVRADSIPMPGKSPTARTTGDFLLDLSPTTLRPLDFHPDAGPLGPAAAAPQDGLSRADGGPGAELRLVRHLAPQLATVLNHRGQGTDLRLDPEELGKVRLTVHTHEGAVTLQVQVERAETADLIRRHVTDLVQEFRTLGYTDVTIDLGSPGRDQRAAPAPAPQAAAESEAAPGAPQPTASIQPQSRPAASGLDLRL